MSMQKYRTVVDNGFRRFVACQFEADPDAPDDSPDSLSHKKYWAFYGWDHAHARRPHQHVEIVWTEPDSGSIYATRIP